MSRTDCGLGAQRSGPEIDPTGLRRIAAYAGKLRQCPPGRSGAQARASMLALPGLTMRWLDYAHRVTGECERIPVPDVDPRIAMRLRLTNRPAICGRSTHRSRSAMMYCAGVSDLLSAATVSAWRARSRTSAHHRREPRTRTLLNEPECVAAIDAFVAQHGGMPSDGSQGSRAHSRAILVSRAENAFEDKSRSSPVRKRHRQGDRAPSRARVPACYRRR